MLERATIDMGGVQETRFTEKYAKKFKVKSSKYNFSLNMK